MVNLMLSNSLPQLPQTNPKWENQGSGIHLPQNPSVSIDTGVTGVNSLSSNRRFYSAKGVHYAN